MATKKPEQVNSALRQWTRGISFTLAMGKTQVTTLVAVHLSRESSDLIGGSRHRGLRCFITGVRGLQERGLVIHYPLTNASDRSRRTKYSQYFAVTPAGQLVVELLSLTGVYQELAAELIEAEQSTHRVRIA